MILDEKGVYTTAEVESVLSWDERPEEAVSCDGMLPEPPKKMRGVDGRPIRCGDGEAKEHDRRFDDIDPWM